MDVMGTAHPMGYPMGFGDPLAISAKWDHVGVWGPHGVNSMGKAPYFSCMAVKPQVKYFSK